MNTGFLHSRVSRKVTGLSAFAAALLSLGSALHGQGYTTNFDDAATFPPGGSLSGQDGWDTNDPYNSTDGRGQSDYVGQLNGYTPANNPNDELAGLGGFQRSAAANLDISPDRGQVFLFHTFSVAGAPTVNFNVDMAITTSSSTFPNNDSFGWSFQSATGTLFSVDFVPVTNAAGAVTAEEVEYTVNGAQTDAHLSITPNTTSLYHLSVGVNVTGKSFGFTLTGSNTGGVDNISLANVASDFNLTDVAATWNLANAASAGSNELIFDNYAVAVPEPSTWALLGAAGVATLGVLRCRRLQA